MYTADDTHRVTISSKEPAIGTVTFRLANLYTVEVDTELDIYQGSKLVVKFYTYGKALEREHTTDNFRPPLKIKKKENTRHPSDIGVKMAGLDLTTDRTEEVISTMANFIVTRTILEVRYAEIPGEWAIATPEERVELEREFAEIPFYWALAPD